MMGHVEITSASPIRNDNGQAVVGIVHWKTSKVTSLGGVTQRAWIVSCLGV